MELTLFTFINRKVKLNASTVTYIVSVSMKFNSMASGSSGHVQKMCSSKLSGSFSHFKTGL